LLKHQTMLKGALSEHRAFHSSLIHTKLLLELVKLVESRLPGEEGALHE